MRLAPLAAMALALALAAQEPTTLRFAVPIADAIARGELDPKSDPDEVMRLVIDAVCARLRSIPGARVRKAGAELLEVELPPAVERPIEQIAQRISVRHGLEMRMLADAEYDKGGVKLDMAEERRRLEAWLDQSDHRERVARDPRELSGFAALSSDQGGRLSKYLGWYPGKISRSARDPARWDYAYATDPAAQVVPVFTPAQHAAGPPPKGAEPEPFLVECFPINLHEAYFTGEDLASLRTGLDPGDGYPCIYYEVDAERRREYADWSEANLGKHTAMIVDGIVRSAPTFRGRILGSGIIAGGFTKDEAAELADSLGALSLPLALVRIGR